VNFARFGQPVGPWKKPPEGAALWVAEIPVLARELLPGSGAVFSEAELKRSLEFPEGPHRQSYLAVRGFVRRTLGALLGIEARDVRITHGPQGKPALEGAPRDLRFNVSHSGGLAVLAVAEGRAVGVDIEFMRDITRLERIADRFFSPAEKAALAKLPADQKGRLFLRIWTVREGVVKATGEGVWASFERLELALSSDRSRIRIVDPTGYSVTEFVPAENCVGSLVLGR
jgi:4'-phosphopantetheinyl transferase